MRVSTQMFSSSYLSELERHQEQLYRLQRQVASGQRLLDPSDDPTAAAQAATLHDEVARNTQYQVNITDALSLVQHSQAVARQLTSLADQTQQLALRAGSDSITPDGRQALAQQVDQLLNEAFDAANDRTLGRYTLSGTHTTPAPYTADRDAQGRILSVTAHASDGSVQRQVSDDITLKVNLNAPDILGGTGSPPGSVDYFATLIQLRDALNANDADTVRALVPTLQSLHDQAQAQVTLADVRAQRLQNVQDVLGQRDTDTRTQLSGLEDLDTAKAALDLQAEQAIYQQALQVGRSILSLSLGLPASS